MHLDQMTAACSCIKPPGGLHSCHLATFSFADVYLFKNQHARYLDLMTTNGVNIRKLAKLISEIFVSFHV